MKEHSSTVEIPLSSTNAIVLRTQRFYASLGTTVYSLTREAFERFLEEGARAGYADPSLYGKALTATLCLRRDPEDLWRGFPKSLARSHVCVAPTDWPRRRWRGALNALRAAQWKDLYFQNWEEPREVTDS